MTSWVQNSIPFFPRHSPILHFVLCDPETYLSSPPELETGVHRTILYSSKSTSFPSSCLFSYVPTHFSILWLLLYTQVLQTTNRIMGLPRAYRECLRRCCIEGISPSPKLSYKDKASQRKNCVGAPVMSR